MYLHNGMNVACHGWSCHQRVCLPHRQFQTNHKSKYTNAHRKSCLYVVCDQGNDLCSLPKMQRTNLLQLEVRCTRLCVAAIVNLCNYSNRCCQHPLFDSGPRAAHPLRQDQRNTKPHLLRGSYLICMRRTRTNLRCALCHCPHDS